jgi:Leucine-rich repeat (LRR) protein
MNSNRLATLPASVSRLGKLQVNNNSLRALPESIGSPGSKLVSIEAKHNQLQSLPADLTGAAELQYLFVSFNKLRQLPSRLAATISVLRAHDNLLDRLVFQVRQGVCFISDLPVQVPTHCMWLSDTGSALAWPTHPHQNPMPSMEVLELQNNQIAQVRFLCCCSRLAPLAN